MPTQDGPHQDTCSTGHYKDQTGLPGSQVGKLECYTGLPVCISKVQQRGLLIGPKDPGHETRGLRMDT